MAAGSQAEDRSTRKTAASRSEDAKDANAQLVVSPGVTLGLVAFGWLFGWLQFAFFGVSYSVMGEAAEVPWREMLWNWLHYGLGALCLPWLVRVAWRQRFARERWLRQLLPHLGRASAVSLAIAATYALLRTSAAALDGTDYDLSRLGHALLRGVFLSDLYFFGAISIAATAVRSALELGQRERNAARLESELATTRLRLLKAQLDPHFLFNTLSVISSSVRRDPAVAERMISRLSDLLRLLLESGGREEVTLSEELDQLAAYVEIQRIRFRDRLVFEANVPAELQEALVPNLVLQPLVENAIQHGMQPRRVLRIEVTAVASKLGIELSVTDDGRGLAAGTLRSGVGLSNTRARLQTLYGDQQELALSPRAESGAVVRLMFPLRYEPVARPSVGAEVRTMEAVE